eukprot:scaffold40487_cov27-Tisochrysis_lutea.AAC.1
MQSLRTFSRLKGAASEVQAHSRMYAHTIGLRHAHSTMRTLSCAFTLLQPADLFETQKRRLRDLLEVQQRAASASATLEQERTTAQCASAAADALREQLQQAREQEAQKGAAGPGAGGVAGPSCCCFARRPGHQLHTFAPSTPGPSKVLRLKI